MYWDSGTAHLLPRLLRLPDGSMRTHGPLFLSERRPVPARRPAASDICPHTGRARLGYDRARVLLDKYAGLDLHQLRHSAATHLGEAEVPLQLIMGKTRHKNPRTAMRYVKPGAEAIALTLIVSLLHTVRTGVRDDVVTMFCKRIATIHKRAATSWRRCGRFIGRSPSGCWACSETSWTASGKRSHPPNHSPTRWLARRTTPPTPEAMAEEHSPERPLAKGDVAA